MNNNEKLNFMLDIIFKKIFKTNENSNLPLNLVNTFFSENYKSAKSLNTKGY